MRIGELAAATGISRDALRFYEKRGLLNARRHANGYRDYPEQAVDWLRYLRTAQQLGFSLQEIEEGMPLFTEAGNHAEALREALQRKLGDLDQRILALTALRSELLHRLSMDMEDCPLRSGFSPANAA